MNIAVKGVGVKENHALENYAMEKAEKLYNYNSQITKIEIELRTEIAHKSKEDDFVADITLHVPGKTLKVSDHEQDLYKATDRAVRRMSETLRREKARHQGLLKRQVRRLAKAGFDYSSQIWGSVSKRVFRR